VPVRYVRRRKEIVTGR
jgi:hypothetical protein